MNLASTINSFATEYTLTRRAFPTVSSGVVVPGATSTVEIRAVVQPATGRELKSLPEGMRTTAAVSIWSPDELRTQSDSCDADLIAVDGESYEVQKVERWDTLGAYYKAIAAKVPR